MDSRTNSPPRRRGLPGRATTTAALALLVAASAAGAASLHTAEVEVSSDVVTVEQGGSAVAPLSFSAKGALSCSTGHEDPPATITLDSVYALDGAGDVTSSEPAVVAFSSDGRRRGGSDNCGVTWEGAPDPYVLALRVSAAADTPLGRHTIRIDQEIKNSPDTGSAGKLGGGSVALTVEVVPASPRPVVAPEPPPPAEQVVLGVQQIAPLRPDLGKSVVLSLVSGQVLVRPPGGGTFVLGDDVEVPVGSLVDATRGVVKVVVESDAAGTLQSAEAWGGAFRATQAAAARPTAVFVLGGPLKAPRSRSATARAAKVTARRKLWVKGKGRFSSRGRRASAIIRGTEWLTEELPAGTRVSVRAGVVRVRDFTLRRTILVRAGRSYLARAKRATARRAPAFTGRAS